MSMVLCTLLCNWLKLSHRTSRKFGLWFRKYRYLQRPFMVPFKNDLQRINMVKNRISQKVYIYSIKSNEKKIKKGFVVYRHSNFIDCPV